MDRERQIKLKAFLENNIEKWRKIERNKRDPLHEAALYYLDAYQTIYQKVFGDVKRP